MLSVWLNLFGVPSRESNTLAARLLDAATQAAKRAALDAPLVVLGGSSMPPATGWIHVPAPAGLPPRDWRATLDVVADSGRTPAGADVLLLSPLAGPVTPGMVNDFLKQTDRTALCVATTPLHGNRHPSWLMALDKTAKVLPRGDILCSSPPEALNPTRFLCPEAGNYLNNGNHIFGSQWLPALRECTGVMVLCPSDLLNGRAYHRTSPLPVHLVPESGITVLLHTLINTENHGWS